MRAKSPTQITLLLLRASAALALTLTPLQLSLDGAMPKLEAAVALAGGDDDSDSGGSDHDSGGSDRGGGGRDHDSDRGSDHDDDDDDNDDDHDDHDDKGGDDNDGHDASDDDHHVNPGTGDRVERAGNDIKVVHPDGTKEEIEGGVYEMKDAAGRTIIERRATQADIDRLKAMAG